MSFFSLWWKDLPSKQRIAVKKLLDTKQLEFVAGGWVMPDEANVHYLSYFTQLIEGHQFLQQHFNVSPRNGWAIDPFGLSTSLNFLQTRAGINNTVFMRTHYILKHFLRENKATEFMWRQLWGK
ncbi:unnamed protein product [Allacma fusca]|uniref:Glycoside hydrolase family 38 N-terminal domain-containing protein n=1 Tax=Allacma fusca TaxID=39272 RepID=A0A8J2KUT6_9HEXA|nr:unnamed protein product [Allacma fusca]